MCIRDRYEIEQNIMFQDNKSVVLLVENGKKSAGKRSRAINIQYFFVTDQVARKKMEVQYCPTKQMWADPMTKPLQGTDFKVGADRPMG